MRGLEDLSWRQFLTPQEEYLIGSSPNAAYIGQFYTPKAIQDGCDVSAVNSIRQTLGTYSGIEFYFVNGDGHHPTPEKDGYIRVILSLLNEAGETIEDPRPVEDGFKIDEESRVKLKFRS